MNSKRRMGVVNGYLSDRFNEKHLPYLNTIKIISHVKNCFLYKILFFKLKDFV